MPAAESFTPYSSELPSTWCDDGRVVQVKTLSPWTGLGMASADTVVELPAGTADAVAVGDDVIIES